MRPSTSKHVKHGETQKQMNANPSVATVRKPLLGFPLVERPGGPQRMGLAGVRTMTGRQC